MVGRCAGGPGAAVQRHGRAPGRRLTRSRIGAVLLTPSDGFGVAATFYSVPLPVDELPDEEVEDDDGGDAVAGGRYGRGRTRCGVPQADVEVEGSSHVFHETRTDVATRGLIRDLADDPGAALTVLVAQLFKQLALHSSGSLETSAAQISATALRARADAADRGAGRRGARPARRPPGRLQGVGPSADPLGRDPAPRREDGADGGAGRHLAERARGAHDEPRSGTAPAPRPPRSPPSAAPTSQPTGPRTPPIWRSTPRSSSWRCWRRWGSRMTGPRR